MSRPFTSTKAFTLLELLIVLLIVGILISIGLYRYQSVVEAAYDKQAQADLRASFINGEAWRVKNGNYGTNITELVTYLNENAENDIQYIAWSDQEPETTGLTPNYTNDPKQVLVSLQPNGSLVAYCNYAQSETYYCVGQSEENVSTFASLVVELNRPFSSSKGSSMAAAYCALATPGGHLPRGCGGNIADQTDDNSISDGDGIRDLDEAGGNGDNQYDGGTEGWFGGGPVGDVEPAVTGDAIYGINFSGQVMKYKDGQTTVVDSPSGVYDKGITPTGVAVNPNGEQVMHVVYQDTGPSTYIDYLRIANTDGSSTGVTNISSIGAISRNPRWIDNDTIMILFGQTLYTADVNSSNELTNWETPLGAINTYNASPSPDGSQIVYTMEDDFGGACSTPVPVIKKININGTGDTLITDWNENCDVSDYGVENISWVGNHIYYLGGTGYNTLGRVPANGGTPVEISAQCCVYAGYSVSPDGAQIAYADYNNSIVVEDSNGAGAPTVVVVAESGGNHMVSRPMWSLSGDRIYYQMMSYVNPFGPQIAYRDVGDYGGTQTNAYVNPAEELGFDNGLLNNGP